MQNLPYDNIEELALTCQAIFKGDQLTIEKAQNTLFEMSKDPVRFTDSMIRIIIDESDTSIRFLFLFHLNSL